MHKTYLCNKWKRGRCKEVVREDIGRCPKCGEAKSRGESLLSLSGDCKCNKCGTNNFRNRQSAVCHSPTNFISEISAFEIQGGRVWSVF